MRTLVRWDPFSEFRSLRHAMDRGMFQFYGPTVWRNADVAMYAAKAAGKNRYRVFGDGLQLATEAGPGAKSA